MDHHVDPTVREHQESDSTRVEAALDAWLAEYEALRAEIAWLIGDGTRYQNFAITLTGLFVTVFGFIIKEVAVLTLPVLLLVPFLFTLLGFLFFRQHEEVYVVAAYLNLFVRPRVRALTGDNDIWGWEEFKGSFRLHSSAKMVLLLRSLLFVLPSILALLGAAGYIATVGLLRIREAFGSIVSAVFIVVFSLDAAIVLALIWHLVSHGDLARSILRIGAIAGERSRDHRSPEDDSQPIDATDD